ncbi:hypothetical protein ACNOYE_32705 [Nannocystaceae bacterium ST9]
MHLFGPPSGDPGDPLVDLDVDPLADGVPDDLAQAEDQLSPAIADLLDTGAPLIVGLLLMIAMVALLAALLRRKLASSADAPTPGPSAVAAALACALIYVFGRLLDPLLASLLTRPSWFPEARWPEVGWFEWKLLGREWAWGALPLAEHPTLALIVHAIVWLVVWRVVRFVLDLLWTHDQRWSRPEQELAFYQRFVGSTTTRRADQQFRRWIGPLVLLALPIHAVAGLRLSTISEGSPAPGTWVIGGLILWMLVFHLLVEGKPPAAKPADEAAADEVAVEAGKLRPAIDRLRQAVEQLRPGVDLEPLELRPAHPGTRAEFPSAIAPLVREIFVDLTGQTKPWAHQAELLGFLGELWRMQAAGERGEVPSLAEERGPTTVQSADTSTPHALMLAPEGSGRTTTTLLAALHVFFDRGATSLVLVRDRATAKAWSRRLERALLGSSARWNVLVCLAGETLASALIAERTPAIVIADLETCEAEVLGDPRTDGFLARLGLVVADDVDSFTGVAEMHLQLCMRRLWALLDRLHEAAYPAALLATCGGSASGMDAWAKHVLAQPMRLFTDDQAARREQLLLRRRDLVDGGGHDVPLALLARACDEAGLPWHLRLAGDAHRHVRRAAFDLGTLRRHFCDDPGDAAIVIVEGTYGDVRREADRLAHAGLALAPELALAGAVVLVLAPPGDEEMVLHEEAEDAPKRELIASLPRAVALAEPRVVRQRHFDRAIGREQDLGALRDRFGAAFVDETVAKLGDSLRLREVLQLDPKTDEIVARTLLKTAREGALGQPIDAACVSDRGSRASLVDAGTSELLLTIDEAVVRAVYPPGRIFLHPRGRFMIAMIAMIADPTGSSEARSLAAEQIDGALRTSSDRSLAIELPEAPIWSTREFGGRAIPVALIAGQVIERIHGVRRFGPGPKLLDHRVFEQPIEVRYGSDLCLIATGTDPRGKHAIVEKEPAWETLIPLCAAIRMMLPAYLRAGEDAVDVDLVEHEGHRFVAIFDRTLGASGIARFVCERGLADLLALARMVLERLVGPEFARLRHIHDRAPHSDPARWQIGDALRWLDDVLDRPPPAETLPGASNPELLGPRVEFVPGEGHGDLGRLWISQTGRTDDLVWTRHTWTSLVPLAGLPPGRVSFDVAVERPAIAAARRRSLLAGSPAIRQPGLLARDDVRFELLEDDTRDLAPIRACLRERCDDAYVDAVLGLVAAIPIRGKPLAQADRGPLAVLARRRADRDAKLLLACALLPDDAAVEIVRGNEGQGWISFVRASGRETWALEGPMPRRVEVSS